MTIKKKMIITVVITAAVILFIIAAFRIAAGFSLKTEGTSSSEADATTDSSGSHLETVSYTINYQGAEYDKQAYVYVPAGTSDQSLNVLYLMHGSSGSGESLAEDLKPLLDQWIADGEIDPLLVVFPTYYPDDSFVVSDYSADYPLNHYFASEEINILIPAVENHYSVYADNTSDQGLFQSRNHRAFGGYSMGGVTTWDVLADQSRYFSAFMPMAGDCWLDQAADVSGDDEIADLLAKGLTDNHFTSSDFRVIAMVGENDGTKYSMQPQLEALRNRHGDLFTDDNLIYWENEDGGHSEASLEAEVHHGIPLLFQ